MNLRKILASFAITGVIVGSATQVVACKEPVSKKIINKIKHKDISVPYNATLKQTTSNINQINTALQEANPGLTLSDLSHLTYADVTLKIDTPVSVKVTATVDDHSYSTTLEITMLNPDETTIAKIKSRYVKIAYNSSLKASDSINTNNIRTQLQQANSSLTNDDLKELSFAGTLKVGSPETVQVTATYGSEKAKTTVTVTMMNAANSIINKIMVPNIAIAYNASTDPTKGDNLINIKKALKNANGSLTSDDLGALTFSGTLSPGKPVKIGVTATVKNVKSDPLTLRVTMHNTAQMIIKKITDAGNSYSNTANQNGLTLKENTPEIYRVLVSKAKLTQDDLDHITLSGLKGDFTPGKQQAITVTANVGSGFSAELTATINYTVDDAATLTKAIESLGTVSVAVPNTNASKDDVGMIKKALMKQGLTATQVSKIASFSGTFAASTPATANITATLGDGLKGTAKFKATYETPTAITGMIKTAKFDNFVASSFDTSTPATSKLLLNAVQEANSGSGLTYGALKTMTVEKATLQADKSVEVTITSQVTGDKTQATKVVKVTATSAKELAGVLQLISKSPQAINFSKLTWDTTKHDERDALAGSILGSLAKRSALNGLPNVFSVQNYGGKAGMITFPFVAPKTPNVTSTITINGKSATDDWTLYAQTSIEIAYKITNTGSKAMPLLTQSSTNPNISSLQTQGNLFNLMLAVNSRLNLPFNYFNQVTFAPETYGAVLKYDQATPVKVMFKVQGMDQETWVSKLFYFKLAY